nr:MAG TPA: hypothetical protein [Caudoviricetes sp.]
MIHLRDNCHCTTKFKETDNSLLFYSIYSTEGEKHDSSQR